MALQQDFWQNEHMFHRFRSKPCQRLLRSGFCEWHSQCQYSHDPEWPRRPPNKHHYTPVLCPHAQNIVLSGGGNEVYSTSLCPAGLSCNFAHTKDEVLYHPQVFKTSLCEEHRNLGGDQRTARRKIRSRCHRYYCPFAHGKQELRTSPLTPEQVEDCIRALSVLPHGLCCGVCSHRSQLVPDDASRDNGPSSSGAGATQQQRGAAALSAAAAQAVAVAAVQEVGLQPTWNGMPPTYFQHLTTGLPVLPGAMPQLFGPDSIKAGPWPGAGWPQQPQQQHQQQRPQPQPRLQLQLPDDTVLAPPGVEDGTLCGGVGGSAGGDHLGNGSSGGSGPASLAAKENSVTAMGEVLLNHRDAAKQEAVAEASTATDDGEVDSEIYERAVRFLNELTSEESESDEQVALLPEEDNTADLAAAAAAAAAAVAYHGMPHATWPSAQAAWVDGTAAAGRDCWQVGSKSYWML